MNDTNILTELRAWRDEFARSHGYDLGLMSATLRELDAAAGNRLTRGEPRRPSVIPPGPAEPAESLTEIKPEDFLASGSAVPSPK